MSARPPRGTRDAGAHRGIVGLLLVLALGVTRPAEAQLARLAAPGPLAKAHASLRDDCEKCHESGRGIAAQRCLACHKPIAERIAARKGVHKRATTDCVTCHKEHRGVDADIRRLDVRTFDHAAQAGFALEGRHATLAQKCASCHKTRSFLKLQTTCASCHADAHKPTLGGTCDTCHSVTIAFRDARQQFDHAKAAFPLEGSHRRVECARCHVNKVYKGLRSALCTDCHRDQHNRKFTAACTTCHTVDGWKTQKVDHAKTAFPLRASHAEVKCAACHKQSPIKVKLAFDKCTACHADPHRGEFRQECTSCHSEQAWKQVKLDHKAKTKTAFELTGKHAEARCEACHKNVGPAPKTAAHVPGRREAAARDADFRGLSTACVSCHADVHRTELGTRCDTCHTTATFRITNFKHARTSDFFGGQHATVTCARCHAPDVPADAPPRTRTDAPLDGWKFKTVATTCATCHKDVHLGQLGTQCDTCHSIGTAKFGASGFAHTRSKYQLTGKHQDVACAKCHKAETGGFPAAGGTAVRFKGLATTCDGCHQDRHLGQLGTRCESCHTPAAFKLPAYKHAADKQTFFVAKHATAKCDECHKQQEGEFPAGRGTAVRYKGFGTACAACHSERDKHQGSLGRNCATCHEPSRWTVVSRAFHKGGVFPLEGRHLSVDCAACHVNGVIKGTPTRCAECHWVRRQDDRYRTRLGTDCERCHRPMSWLAVNWNHESQTGMKLNPVHRALGCESCHQNQNFSSGLACNTCHQQDYLRAANPNHASAGFPTSCDACHRAYQSSWQQAVFNHNAAFALVGLHAAQPCASCHRNGVYKGQPTDCYSCHRTDYEHSQNPNHAAAGYPVTCQSCHRPTDGAFKGNGSFKHDATFALSGLHATQACAACHKNNVYKGTPRECYPCHQANYAQTKNPNHAAAGFSTTCESCHKPTDPTWLLATTAHGTFTLVGLHATQPCSACHANGIYKGTPRDCYSCHQANYAATRNPNHAAAGYPTTCDSCHRPGDATWLGANSTHLTFPLVGVHATQACAACHRNGVYKGTARDCYGCHQSNYAATRNPNHAAAGFPTTCDSCHKPTDASWVLATLNHSSFTLVGVHATQPCAACHKNGVYKGTPRDCYSCHQANYAQTTNPNHAAAGFPTTCDSCHKPTDATWLLATFNHTWFPNTGRHSAPCSTCHTDPTNYKVFSCLTCHDRASTDSHHVGRAGYRYDSQACYSCHPRGST